MFIKKFFERRLLVVLLTLSFSLIVPKDIAHAQNNFFEEQKFARELATILAGESFCSLKYEQPKVIEFINKSLPPTELQFTRTLASEISSAEISQNLMTPSVKIAHCIQVENAARQLRFLS